VRIEFAFLTICTKHLDQIHNFTCALTTQILDHYCRPHEAYSTLYDDRDEKQFRATRDSIKSIPET